MARVDLQELGQTGLVKQGGVVYEEYLRELQGTRWRKVVREMIDDPVIGAILFAVEMLLRQVEWQVEAGSDAAEDQAAAEFVEQCFVDMSHSWADTLSEILTMLPWGWAYLECVFKVRGGDNGNPMRRSKFTDGRIGWRKWSIRAQETLDRWEFDEGGGIQGMWQVQEAGAPVLIPIDKALLFRTKASKGNPEGHSILRAAYRAWYFRKNIENIEGIGIERDLAGLPVAHVPPEILASSATAEQRTLLGKIKEIVTNIRRDEQEGVVWPLAYDPESGKEMFKLELLSTGGTRQFDTNAIIARYDQRITMSVLADFMLLGAGKTGSWALSADKSSLFKTALESFLSSIADVINTHGIPKLLRFNGMTVKEAPRYVPGAIGKVDLAVLVDFVERLSKSGAEMFPDTELENHLRSEANLPLLTEEQIAEREKRAAKNLAAAMLNFDRAGQTPEDVDAADKGDEEDAE